MAQGNFKRCLAVVLKHEGGYSDHPKDPGGATNKGVTLDTYSLYKKRVMNKAELKAITDAEVADLYRRYYWDQCAAETLPAGVDLAVFDMAVNYGPKRARKFLQETAHVTADGIVGPKTLASASVTDPVDLIKRISARRMAFYRKLSTFKTFGKGWTNRVKAVETAALKMVKTLRPLKPKTGAAT